MNEEIDLEQKKLKMKIVKTNSLEVKTKIHKLNKHFPILQKTKYLKAYSTKLVSNFVPTLRPKQSFCKPAFMQLNQNQPKIEIEIEKEDSDLDIISSSEGIDEFESESNQSSSMTSSNEEIDKEEEKLPDNDIQMNNISSFGLNCMNVGIDKNKIVQEIPEYKMFNEEKINLNLNKINNTNINNNDAQANENKNKNKKINNLSQNIINSKKKPLTILDVLKNKNKMIK